MISRAIGVAVALAVLACGGGEVPPVLPHVDTATVAPPAPEPVPAAAEDHACPQGVVVAPGWPGEWPSPIVQVTAPTAVQGYAAPCATAAEVACTVAVGLYHPWAPSDVTFASLSAVETFETTEAMTVGGKDVAAGTTVVMQSYLAEGYCTLVIAGEEIEDTCPEVMGLAPDGPYVRTAEPVDFPERQLFLVPCQGGGEAWVAPQDVLDRPTAQAGEFLEYGRVGPKGSGGF